jgi:hypothetical protein
MYHYDEESFVRTLPHDPPSLDCGFRTRALSGVLALYPYLAITYQDDLEYMLPTDLDAFGRNSGGKIGSGVVLAWYGGSLGRKSW